MRVLVVHNRYVSAVPSGENAAVDDEIATLREAGIDVVTHIRSSDEIARVTPGLAVRPVFSKTDAREVAAKLDGVDVVHLHNPYPLLSPYVVRVAKRAGKPVVQTVHNYRHGCVAGSHYRDGHVCEDCLGTRTRWPGVAHGCYRGSRAQSVVLTAAELVHGGTWRQVDRYLALTSFAKDKLVAAGLPAERIDVRPTSRPDPGEPTPPGEGLLFVGRLDEEKGAPLLYAAWRDAGRPPLTVIGDGTHKPPPGVDYRGQQPADVVAHDMERCAAVVVPSVVYEGYPRVVVEAFSRGRPVVATDVGPLPSIITPDRGWVAPPGSLASALRSVTPDAARGAAARAHYVAELTPEIALRRLLDVYTALVVR